jgi:succinate dehydrogenase hydrophobic anchor subunit
MRVAAVRMGVLVLDVVMRVRPVRMRVSGVAVAVLVIVHFIAHAPDAGTSLTSAQWCKVLLIAT